MSSQGSRVPSPVCVGVTRGHWPLQEKRRGRWSCMGCPLDGDHTPSCLVSLLSLSVWAEPLIGDRSAEGKALRCRVAPASELSIFCRK